ncbi:MAG TPA: hypothetical protein VGP07_20500 [Polyangia bacterium]|jgi:hypothetical protein
MNPRVQRLRAEIASDVAAYQTLVEELSTLAPLDRPAVQRSALAQAAVALHHAYGAMESALTRIARHLEDGAPEGPDWHQSLVAAMALDVEGVRPAVLSGPTLTALRRLLGFRHFFRHAYAIDLDGSRLEELRNVAVSSRDVVVADFNRFDAILAVLASQ